MTRTDATLSEIRFDPKSLRYEGIVNLRVSNRIERIPCALRFPISTGIRAVREALIRQARERLRRDRPAATSLLQKDGRIGDQSTAPRAIRLPSQPSARSA